jgi:hypothetical protein
VHAMPLPARCLPPCLPLPLPLPLPLHKCRSLKSSGLRRCLCCSSALAGTACIMKRRGQQLNRCWKTGHLASS